MSACTYSPACCAGGCAESSDPVKISSGNRPRRAETADDRAAQRIGKIWPNAERRVTRIALKMELEIFNTPFATKHGWNIG
jgi:hypothetical protein